ncbi:hypothetical protein KSP40_PGU018609 [Platanthera guangdongensis]|uniref:Anticodon-binding domain-containing protein n=1 Tax=Platanthera guangdongensis TaxID=2320717 RepID=A0ABR2MBN3_9ASPA
MFDKNPISKPSMQSLQPAHQQFEHLRAAGFRVEHDFREIYSVAWKFYDWERKGVPLRIEIKPECMTENQFLLPPVAVSADRDSVSFFISEDLGFLLTQSQISTAVLAIDLRVHLVRHIHAGGGSKRRLQGGKGGKTNSWPDVCSVCSRSKEKLPRLPSVSSLTSLPSLRPPFPPDGSKRHCRAK